jgi:hypothetical protein
MTLNWLGVAMGAVTFLAIWIGHVSVRKIEAASASLWPPTVLALVLGLALEAGALISHSTYVSGALGIAGITVLWDALEFTRQHNRIKHGHAPANPRNPRHARLLAENPSASTVDWLNREPVGRPVKADEALALVASHQPTGRPSPASRPERAA